MFVWTLLFNPYIVHKVLLLSPFTNKECHVQSVEVFTPTGTCVIKAVNLETIRVHQTGHDCQILMELSLVARP